MKTRKEIHFRNRYWKRVQGGCHCYNCGQLIIGDLQAYKHKETGIILCRDCYKAGVKVNRRV